jgi:hypothetical protein
MDDLFGHVDAAVRDALSRSSSRAELYTSIRRLVCDGLADAAPDVAAVGAAADSAHHPAVPCLSEPWYCCAEPTAEQFAHL